MSEGTSVDQDLFLLSGDVNTKQGILFQKTKWRNRVFGTTWEGSCCTCPYEVLKILKSIESKQPQNQSPGELKISVSVYLGPHHSEILIKQVPLNSHFQMIEKCLVGNRPGVFGYQFMTLIPSFCCSCFKDLHLTWRGSRIGWIAAGPDAALSDPPSWKQDYKPQLLNHKATIAEFCVTLSLRIPKDVREAQSLSRGAGPMKSVSHTGAACLLHVLIVLFLLVGFLSDLPQISQEDKQRLKLVKATKSQLRRSMTHNRVLRICK